MSGSILASGVFKNYNLDYVIMAGGECSLLGYTIWNSICNLGGDDKYNNKYDFESWYCHGAIGGNDL